MSGRFWRRARTRVEPSQRLAEGDFVRGRFPMTGRLKSAVLGAPRSGFRGSADALGQRDDNPLRTPDISHPPRALVLADATDQPVAVRGRPINGRLQVIDLEGHVLQPSAPVRRCSITISVRESGMPMTMSRNSPSTTSCSRPLGPALRRTPSGRRGPRRRCRRDRSVVRAAQGSILVRTVSFAPP